MKVEFKRTVDVVNATVERTMYTRVYCGIIAGQIPTWIKWRKKCIEEITSDAKENAEIE